jgi:uncharacterized protein (DUF1810 family)
LPGGRYTLDNARECLGIEKMIEFLYEKVAVQWHSMVAKLWNLRGSKLDEAYLDIVQTRDYAECITTLEQNKNLLVKRDFLK